jgi:hypothetical protein
MDREDMMQRLYAKTELDFDMIEGFTDNQLRDMLGLNVDGTTPKKIERETQPKIKPRMTGFKFIEHDGALYRVETWTVGSLDQHMTIRCGATVRFQDRTVSASIVLHWLRTGELVKRVPRTRKTWQAAIRVNGKVKHLGRFATKEERDIAVLNHKLGFVPTK